MKKVVMPWDFSKALEAAGLIQDRDRITEINIRCKSGEAVVIEVTYLADERIYLLAEPDPIPIRTDADERATGDVPSQPG